MGKVIVVPGKNDLYTTHPELAKEWDYQKNAGVTPATIFAGVRSKFFWLCPIGHSYEASLASRSRQNTSCPFCSNSKVLSGFNDLETKRPELSAEFDLEANYPTRPSEVSPASEKKYHWTCPRGHSYFTSVKVRHFLGTGCPVCANLQVSRGENDFESVYPQLSASWNKMRNGDLKASEIIAGSPKQYWWVCDKGHDYLSSPAIRGQGGGCPVCAGKKVVQGFNDLATTAPQLVKEFDLEKNHPLTPESVMTGSNKKFHWICVLGHSWVSSPNQRQSTGCPTCSNRKLLSGFNDLETKNPTLAKEWNYPRNSPLDPSRITFGSTKKVWWICPLNPKHEWQNSPVARAKGQGCPVCKNVVVVAGVNDLSTVRPDLARQWNLERNFPLLPNQVAAGTSKKFWWLCEQDPTHEWRTSCDSRLAGRGCPSCSKSGFDPGRAGVFYFIENQDLRARKVGITNKERRNDRLQNFASDGWVILQTVESSDGDFIQSLETRVLRWIRKDCGLPQFLGKEDMGRTGGYSETFSMDTISNAEIIRKIDELKKL
jgi:hypothetical protein